MAMALENARLYEATLDQQRAAQELRMARVPTDLPASAMSFPA
jgi:hypothetical protein